MDKLPEDITIYAKDYYLIYGDGYSAQIVAMRPTNENGKDVWEIIIRPSQELIKAYNLRPGSPGYIQRPDGTVLVRQSLAYEYIIQLNPDPSWNRWLYLLNYDGSMNPSIKKVMPTDLIREIEDWKSKFEIERQKREVAEEKMKMIQTNLPKYLNRDIIPMLKGMMEVGEKFIPNKPGQPEIR